MLTRLFQNHPRVGYVFRGLISVKNLCIMDKGHESRLICTKVTIIFLISSLFLTSQAVYCPGEGWQLSQDKCLKLLEYPYSMEDALRQCVSEPHHPEDVEPSILLEIWSQSQQTSVETFLHQFPNSPGIWISAKRVDGTQNFTLLSSNQTLAYNNWGIGFPTNSSGRNCIEFQTTVSRGNDELGLWKDVTCSKGNWAICEKTPNMTADEVVVAVRALKWEDKKLLERIEKSHNSSATEHTEIRDRIHLNEQKHYDLVGIVEGLDGKLEALKHSHENLLKKVDGNREDLQNLEHKVEEAINQITEIANAQTQLKLGFTAFQEFVSNSLIQINAQIAAFTADTNTKFAQVNGRIDTTNSKTIQLENGLSELEYRHTGLSTEYNTFKPITNLRLDTLKSETQDLNSGIIEMNSTTKSLQVAHATDLSKVENALTQQKNLHEGLRSEFNSFIPTTNSKLDALLNSTQVLNTALIGVNGNINALEVTHNAAMSSISNSFGDVGNDLGKLRVDVTNHQAKIHELQIADTVSDGGFAALLGRVVDLEIRINLNSLALVDLEEDVDEIENEVESLGDIPEGYIYIQLPGKPGPAEIWPKHSWAEVSSEYAGNFFRVLGGKSAPFGEVQKEDFKTFSTYYACGGQQYRGGVVPKSGPSQCLETARAGGGGSMVGMTFEWQTGSEVRPENMAMRVWERI